MDLYKEMKAFKYMAATMSFIEATAFMYFGIITVTVFFIAYLFLSGDSVFTGTSAQIQTMVRMFIVPLIIIADVVAESVGDVFRSGGFFITSILVGLFLAAFPQLVYQGDPCSIFSRTLISGVIFLLAKAFREGTENQIHFREIRLAGGAVDGEKNSGQDRTEVGDSEVGNPAVEKETNGQ